ncbi:hypothetical protein GMSM_07550 [Geomonas sp. Red276]
MKISSALAGLAALSLVVAAPVHAQETPAAAAPAAAPAAVPAAVPPVIAVPAAPVPADQLAELVKENTLLKEKLRALESCSVTGNDLAVRNAKRLKEIAVDIRAQRQGLADFEGYVKWMSSNVAGYSKYISAGSVAAGFAKVLPIPYAGQASVFTKFVANATLSLSSASVSINNYLVTSQQFLNRTDKLDPAKGVNSREVSELVRFADQDLLKGMQDVQEKLASTSELSASSLSFLESLHHYLGATDEYWAKTKSLLKSDDKKEKGFLAESAAALRNRALAFNGKFRGFGDTVKKDEPLIKSLIAYDDLIREMDPTVANLK